MRRMSAPRARQSALTVLERHVVAFNDRDVERLLAGFTDDAEWVTGEYRCRGHAALEGLFRGAFNAVAPQLEIVRMIPGADVVAAEFVEHMTIDRKAVQAPIAGFYTLRDGRMSRAKIYREGSADIPTAQSTPSSAGGT